MAKSGWDIAMRRIDAEFDIAQFLASSLVRKIAANGFRLAATDRSKYQTLPDHVIERIEEIVREAYLEAGEDVGGEILREHLWQQVLNAHRGMLASGELILEDEFLNRLCVTKQRLSSLLADGSIFKLEVDGAVYYPALLADTEHDLKRLAALCRILWPVEPMSRLGFFSTRRGSLGDLTPLEVMQTDAGYRRVREVAKAWAAEWSLTIVKIYVGEYLSHDAKLPVVCAGFAEIDPRRSIWQRAAEALQLGGNLRPGGPYPKAKTATVFVLQSTAGGPQDIFQMRLDIITKRGAAHTSVVSSQPPLDLEPVLVGETDDVVTIVRKVVASVRGEQP
jgi:hypothetical protein